MMRKRLFGLLLSITLMLGMVSALSLITYADGAGAVKYGLWVGNEEVTSENLTLFSLKTLK